MRIHLKRLSICSEGKQWEIDVYQLNGNAFEIAGRSTSFVVYISKTEHGYLVSEPYHHRCGYVPADVNATDVMKYMDIENRADAVTLAAGLKYLIERMAAGPVHTGLRVVIEITQDGWKETLYSGKAGVTKEKFKTPNGIMGTRWKEEGELYDALNGLSSGCMRVMNALGKSVVH